jgi:malate synthase
VELKVDVLNKENNMSEKVVEEKVRELMNRFWRDVQGLPWADPSWVNNKGAREQTRNHFVEATTADVMKAVKKEDADESTS